MTTVLLGWSGRFGGFGLTLEVTHFGQADPQVAGFLIGGAQAGHEHGFHGIRLAETDIHTEFVAYASA